MQHEYNYNCCQDAQATVSSEILRRRIITRVDAPQIRGDVFIEPNRSIWRK
jgi:hypothetical protein